MCVKPKKAVPPVPENHYSMGVFQTGEETPLQASGDGIVEKRRDIARLRRAAHIALRLCENNQLPVFAHDL